MKFNVFYSMIVAALLSIVISRIVYFGFTPNYAADIFSRESFNKRFDHDVFKYRILSKYLLLATDDWLKKDIPTNKAEKRILVNTPDGTDRFYTAFFFLNAFFLILTSVLVVLLVNLDDRFKFTSAEKMLIIFLVPIVIGLSQFTVCCYDVSSFFFQLLILYIFLRWNGKYFLVTLSAISLLIVISTLNRESSALSVSLISMLLITQYGLKRKVFLGIGAMALSFLATYAGLHYFIVDPTHIRIINLEAGLLFLPTNIIGLLFWGLFFYLPMEMADSDENRWLIAVFFLFSLPYIYTVLKDGVLWEIRLYIPLFLGALFLSKLDTSLQVLKISDITLRRARREIQ